MIAYNEYILPNGLKVVLSHDPSTPVCAIDLVYRAGSKFDPPEKSGLAHLFEHLMFAGSKHIPDFDEPQQMAGGENNAVTNPDYTHYYQTIPAQNLEVALWLEADRMFNLSLAEEKVEIQRQVVIEEYYETCINIPFGEMWHHLAPMAYKVHGYQWPTIGRNTADILNINSEDLRAFYNTHYHPSNAVIAITGPIPDDKVLSLLNKYFKGNKPKGVGTTLQAEPEQSEARSKRIPSQVPLDMIFLAFPIPARMDVGYYAADLITDILANGPSAILLDELVFDRHLFSHMDAYITGTDDPGLLIIEGRLLNGHSIDTGLQEIWKILERLKESLMTERALHKWIEKLATNYLIADAKPLTRTMNLAQLALLGKTELINAEIDIYKKISTEQIRSWAKRIFKVEKSNTLIYAQKS